MSIVYIARAIDGRLAKIGTTTNRAAVRLRELETASLLDLELACWFDGGQQCERWCHWYCVNERHKGEWFHLRGPVLNLIEVVSSRGPDVARLICPLARAYDGLGERVQGISGYLNPLPNKRNDNAVSRRCGVAAFRTHNTLQPTPAIAVAEFPRG